MAFTANPVGTARVRGDGIPAALLVARSTFQQELNRDLEQVFIPDASGDFAVVATYTHKFTGAVKSYPIIEDHPTATANIQTEADPYTYKTSFKVATHRLAQEPDNGDVVFLKGKKYRVDEYEDDGLGVTTIFLRHN